MAADCTGEGNVVEPIKLWQPVVGWEGLYEVNQLGEVRSLDRRGRSGLHRGKMLKPNLLKNGYLAVNPSRPGLKRQSPVYVHRLVLEAFWGPAPAAHEGCHRDGDRLNNKLENLHWGTSKKNGEDMVLHDRSTRGRRNKHCKLLESAVLEIRRSTVDPSTTAAAFGISPATVYDIRKRRSWAWLEG